MDENKTQEGEAEQSAIDKAEALLAKMEEANKKAEEIYKKNEAILARAVLSGKSFAGNQPPVKEETPAEYRDRIMRGG